MEKGWRIVFFRFTIQGIEFGLEICDLYYYARRAGSVSLVNVIGIDETIVLPESGSGHAIY